MAYDGRLLRLAQERYEADRSVREADLAEQREQLYARRPRLREIQDQLRRTASRVNFFIFLIKVLKRYDTVIFPGMFIIHQNIFLFKWFIPVIRIKEKNIFILYTCHQNIMLFLQIQTNNRHATMVQCMINAAFFTYVHASP